MEKGRLRLFVGGEERPIPAGASTPQTQPLHTMTVTVDQEFLNALQRLGDLTGESDVQQVRNAVLTQLDMLEKAGQGFTDLILQDPRTKQRVYCKIEAIPVDSPNSDLNWV